MTAYAQLRNIRIFIYLFVGNGNTFQDWLEDTLTKHSDAERATRLLAIESAPAFRVAHPREEHFTPLLVAVGGEGYSPC